MKALSMFVVIALVSTACAKAPPSLSPAGVKIWQANEAVVAIGMVQHAAIQLNGLQRCVAAVCAPVLSDRNTGVVVDAVTEALTVMRKLPDGWRATSLAALVQIEARLDALGKDKLASYLRAARSVIDALT